MNEWASVTLENKMVNQQMYYTGTCQIYRVATFSFSFTRGPVSPSRNEKIQKKIQKNSKKIQKKNSKNFKVISPGQSRFFRKIHEPPIFWALILHVHGHRWEIFYLNILVTVNGVELYNGINTTPKAWPNVAVWASDNWWLAAKANIRNAVLTTDGCKYSINPNTNTMQNNCY